MAGTLHKLAEVFADEGITPDADEYFARSMDLFSALGDRMEVALVEMDRAHAWSKAGDHAKALAFGEHALAIRVEHGNELYLGAALHNLGMLYGDAGDHAKAIDSLERALVLADKTDNDDGILTTLCSLADEYACVDLDLKAIECYLRVLALAEHADDRDRLARRSTSSAGCIAGSRMMRQRSRLLGAPSPSTSRKAKPARSSVFVLASNGSSERIRAEARPHH